MAKSFKKALLGIVLLTLSLCDLSTIYGATPAEEMHQNGWRALVTQSRQDKYAMYAMYISRTLAVSHPEIYLKADGLWETIIKGYPGWQTLYDLRDRDFSDEAFNAAFYVINDAFRAGPAQAISPAGAFSWSAFQWEKHRAKAVAGDAIYPEQAPFLPLLDMRLPNLWNSMNGVEWKTPRLSLAEFLYFEKKARGEDVYMLITDHGYGYVASMTSGESVLYDPLTGSTIKSSELDGQVFLVMNDTSVWYPLMDRDDRDKSQSLNAIVASFATEGYRPSLTSIEEELVGTLRGSTKLSSTEDALWAEIFAGQFINQNAWRVTEIRELYRPLFPQAYQENLGKYGDVISLMAGISLVVTEMANRLSPATALLAQSMTDSSDVRSCLQKLSTIYTRWFKRNDNEFVYGQYVRIWLPTIEDKILSSVGDCIVEACNTGSAMALRSESTWRVFIPNWWEITDNGVNGGHVIAGVYSSSGRGQMSNNQNQDEGPLFSGPQGNLAFVNIYEVGKGFISTSENINGVSWPRLDRPYTNMEKGDTVDFVKGLQSLEPDMRIGSGRSYPFDDFLTLSPSNYAGKLEEDKGTWDPFWPMQAVAIDPPTPPETSAGSGGGCNTGGMPLQLWGLTLILPLMGLKRRP